MRGLLRARAWTGVALLTGGLVAGCADQPGPLAPAPAATTAPRRDVTPTNTLPLVITELLPNPAAVADAGAEWIEVFNPNSTPVDLNGYRLQSGPGFPASETHTINTSVLVPACGVVVLGASTDQVANGGAPVTYAYGTSIVLNNSNTDWLVLKDASNTLVDSVSYSIRNGGVIVSPGATPANGASWVVVNPVQDNSVVQGNTNWIVTPAGTTFGAGDRGTPGTHGYSCNQQPPGEITTVTVAPSNPSVQVGASTGLTATARDANGTPVPTTFTWSSSNSAVATVSATGVVTGVAQGQAVITATAPNAVSGTATVTVTAAPQPGVPATITVSVNSPARWPVTFTKPAFATVRDGNGTIISPPPPLTWTSSNSNVATVDALGYITGVSVGTATIRVEATPAVFATVNVQIIAADAPTTAVYRNHIEFGRPLAFEAVNDLDFVSVNRRQFRAAWSANRGAPTWVSWNLNATQFGNAPRCDCFSTDLGLPSWVTRIVDFDYRNGGYDRGHMVQSESRTTTDQENAATFLLTNIVPQAGENNQGPWLGFENYLNDLARTQNREIYVMAGGEYGTNPPTLKNEGKVFVPNWTWKVAVVLPSGQGLPFVTSPDVIEVIAVRMPNRVEPGVDGSAVGIRNVPWQNFAVSVDNIEARVKLDLLSRLPNAIEDIVEARIFGAPALVASQGGSLLDLRAPGWH
ncbi:MAG: DNA/RNA non-specific endonuclease [Gemmatimonadaceae bacterium]|nr:DNA/RNA non-specific endonuclease [Gemmatimonadaceae bacterium]